MHIEVMKPNAFKLILITMFGSAGMAALTLRATGSIMLAFLTYSIGGAALMALLAGIMVWWMGRNVALAGAKLEDWERDKALERFEQSGEPKDDSPDMPEDERRNNVG